jgi:DNA-binding transcriptional LysR family regulator
MNPRDLPDLATLALVARHRSFARAAAELGMSRSALSHAVRGLESRMGVRLLNRTTRSVSPTTAGERLLAQLGPALDQIGQAVDEANGLRDRPAGRLRLNVPRLAALLVLSPALPGFLAAHPDLELELSIEDATVDIVAQGFDAGVRFGERLASDMIALPIGPPVEFAVVGSPRYFAAREPPRTPHDLPDHACIRYRMRGSGRLFDWEFEREGRELAVTVDGPLTLDAPELMVRAAADGVGLAYAALVDVEARLATGELVRVLADWCPPAARLHLYYPSRRHVPVALRALIDWLRQPSA